MRTPHGEKVEVSPHAGTTCRIAPAADLVRRLGEAALGFPVPADRSSPEYVPSYTVNATIHVDSEADRAQLQSLLDQGLRELTSIASRYGATVTDSSATVEQ